MLYFAAVDRWIIDRRKLNLPLAAAALAPALKPDALAATGGLLFKACVHKEAFRLGLLPWIAGGQRTRHYDIRLPGPESRHLIGSLTATGEMSLLFRNKDVDGEDRDAYRFAIGLLSTLFQAAAPGRNWPFDAVTPMLFLEAGVYEPLPASLGDVPPPAP